MLNNIAGSFNSCLGVNCNNQNYNNTTCLGYNSITYNSNQVILGDSNTSTFIYGNGTQNLSDVRDKTDIKDTALGLDFIM
jgi:hypothetical protein